MQIAYKVYSNMGKNVNWEEGTFKTLEEAQAVLNTLKKGSILKVTQAIVETKKG